MEFTDVELLAYLDEALPHERMTALEQRLRTEEPLRVRVSVLRHQRDDGRLTVSEVWRSARLTCPSRTQLGSYLLGALDDQLRDYLEFHLDVVGCRWCNANREDLQATLLTAPETEQRRQKFFQSSAGYVKGRH